MREDVTLNLDHRSRLEARRLYVMSAILNAADVAEEGRESRAPGKQAHSFLSEYFLTD